MSKLNIVLLAVLSLSYLSCSTGRPAANAGSQEPGRYPGWYPASVEAAETQSGFAAYGLAIAGDSAEAVDKAVVMAKSNLEQSISDRLESIRTDAIEGSENSSALDSPSFIFALRNAEGEVSGAATTSRKMARSSSDYGSYRGFAEVTLTRQELIEYLESELSSHQAPFQVLKDGLNE